MSEYGDVQGVHNRASDGQKFTVPYQPLAWVDGQRGQTDGGEPDRDPDPAAHFEPEQEQAQDGGEHDVQPCHESGDGRRSVREAGCLQELGRRPHQAEDRAVDEGTFVHPEGAPEHEGQDHGRDEESYGQEIGDGKMGENPLDGEERGPPQDREPQEGPRGKF